MNAQDVIHKPVIGRVVLAITRTVMRVINHVPAIKRRMQEKEMALRKIKDARHRVQMA
jgi:hypothetical protein